MKYCVKGILPAMVTPLNDDNTIKKDGAVKLIKRHVQDGADGLYVCGATGEGVVLQKNTRMDMCELVISEVKKAVPVIVHVGAIDLKTALELARHAEKSGADAIASIPPFYYPYGNDSIYSYYKELASAVNIPVMIYYAPLGNTVLNAKLIAKMFKDFDNVTSLKWSVRDYCDLINVKDMTNGEINILNGPDETMICGLMAGADGAIGSTYNIMLKYAKNILKAFAKSDMQTCRIVQTHINRVINILMETGCFLQALKYTLFLQGIDVGNAVYPFNPFDNKTKSEIKEKLMEIGFEY